MTKTMHKTLLVASALFAATPALAQYVYTPPPQQPASSSNGRTTTNSNGMPIVPSPYYGLYNTIRIQGTAPAPQPNTGYPTAIPPGAAP